MKDKPQRYKCLNKITQMYYIDSFVLGTPLIKELEYWLDFLKNDYDNHVLIPYEEYEEVDDE